VSFLRKQESRKK